MLNTSHAGTTTSQPLHDMRAHSSAEAQPSVTQTQPQPHSRIPNAADIAVSAPVSQASTSAPASQQKTLASQVDATAEPAKPPADMEALARRIGMASKAGNRPLAEHQAGPVPSKHFAVTMPGAVQGSVNALSSSRQASAAGSPPHVVPPEIQAIIQKLVNFIKVGSPSPWASSLRAVVW